LFPDHSIQTNSDKGYDECHYTVTEQWFILPCQYLDYTMLMDEYEYGSRCNRN